MNEQRPNNELASGYSDRLAAVIDRLALLVGRTADALPSALTMVNPAQQSSVEIEGRAKGAPGITVKVYGVDPAAALDAATTLYDQAVAKYDRTEGLNAAATEMLAVLEALLAEDQGSVVYGIRDNELLGWDGPRVTAYSEAVKAASEIVRRFGEPKGGAS